jgi:hypothetical protein
MVAKERMKHDGRAITPPAAFIYYVQANLLLTCPHCDTLSFYLSSLRAHVDEDVYLQKNIPSRGVDSRCVEEFYPK